MKVESLLLVHFSNEKLLWRLYSAECAESSVDREQCACYEAGGIAAQELYGAVQLVDIAETFHRGLGKYFLAAVGQ